MRLRSRTFALALALAACSSPGEPPDQDPLFPMSPNPRDITVTLQADRAASARITTAGGAVSATAADGTVYTLTLPADALAFDTTITITPIATLSGLDAEGGRFIGVRLEPADLQLFEPASLRLAPPEGPDVGILGFTSRDGHDVHLAPVVPDADKLELLLMHFSIAGGRINQGDAGPGSGMSDILPSDLAAQLDYRIAEAMRAERERQRNGNGSDVQLQNELTKIFVDFWNQVLSEMLPRLQVDCAYMRDNMHIPLFWSRMATILGFEQTFAPEHAQVADAMIGGFKNCWDELVDPCLHPRDKPEARSYARTLALLGVDDPKYDTENPEIQCGAWQGSATATGPSAYGGSETITASVIWDVESTVPAPGGGGITLHRVLDGGITWHYTPGTHPIPGCSVTVPDHTFPMARTDGQYLIDTSIGEPGRYMASGQVVGAFVSGTESCPDRADRTVTFEPQAWLNTGFDWRPMPGERTVTGSATINGRTYGWNFTKTGPARR
jgi:hypothetical protein